MQILIQGNSIFRTIPGKPKQKSAFDTDVKINNLLTATSGTPLIVIAGGDLRAQSSMAAHKTNVKAFKDALADIRKLRPVTFTSLLPDDDPKKIVRGLIAEEVWEAIPDLKIEGFYDQLGLLSTLIAAVQSLADQLDALQPANT